MISPFTILQRETGRSTGHSHEGFSNHHLLEKKLQTSLKGDVLFDDASRALYSTDASNYRQVPIGVVLPRDVDDVLLTMAACRELGAAVLSRGGGTSLAGQGCNVAVIIDFSRYMRSIIDLNPMTRRATVQPGVILDVLRLEAEKYDLTYAPDPATHSRCTLGGMIGNNSCGVHALMGGKTVDNVEELDILLYDGTRMRVGPTSDAELTHLISLGGRRGEIYAGLKRLRDQYEILIRERFPDIPRRVSGYNLDQLLPENGFNVARALVGTEGTCVTVLEAVCELKPSPQHRRLIALGFSDAFVAADHVPAILEFMPIGLEGFDGLLVDFMRRKNLVLDDVNLLPEGRGFLLCEFGADSGAEVEAMSSRLIEALPSFEESPCVAQYNSEEAKRVWGVRESALGASVFVPGEKSGWEGWEDSAVPPEALGRYLRDLFKIIDSYGYQTPIYGHFGQGCVHLRITFDLKTAEGAMKYRDFIEEAADVVLKYGGSFSGEHGDGQARASLLPKMFGPELMQAFRDFKALWDPSSHMNPGKLIDPVGVYDPIDNLRIGPGYRAVEPTTWFQFPEDGGSFSEATTRCVGVGACRKEDHGTMCPSYMATREEKHSTRGRAHLLWEMMQGNVIKDGWRNRDVKEALDLCLSCKACKTECPVNVDVATWKSEFLAHYYEGRVHPLSHYGFGFMDRWVHIAAIAPRMLNLSLRVPGVEEALKLVLGVAGQRRLPPLSTQPFLRTFLKSDLLPSNINNRHVLLWPDTWNNYFNPAVLNSAVKVLRASGNHVLVPKKHICCGRPLYDFGFLDQARKYLLRILNEFEPQILAGIPVVMLEPSCATVFRDELIGLFPRDKRAIMLSRQTMMLSDVLSDSQNEWQPPQLKDRHIVVHGHCHQKSVLSMKDDMSLLRATGASIDLLDSGCCGMAGPFGFDKQNYKVSQTLGERVLLPAVRRAAPDTLLVTNGFSCREQIRQNTSRNALHVSQVLAGDI